MQLKSKKNFYQDDAVLEKAIQEAYPKVFSYLYHRTLDATLAKDLTQETFYRFFSHLDQYEHQGKLLNYLYRIALHLVYDHTKTKGNRMEELQEERIQDDTYDGEKLFHKKEELLMLRSWIQELPAHLQDVLLLRYDEELRFKDISQITGIHVSTLKSQVNLALAMLKKRAQKEEWK